MRTILVILALSVVLALTVVAHETPAHDHGLLTRAKLRKARDLRKRFPPGNFNPGKGKFNPPPPQQGGANPPPPQQGGANPPPPQQGGANPPPPQQGGAPPASSTDFNQNTLSGPPNGQVCNVSNLSKINGNQNKAGGCSTTQLGEIPSVDKMVSTLITSPNNGATVKANTPFTVTVKSTNLELGNFDDPNTQYYLFSQQLNKQGVIKGHTHVVVQQMQGQNVPSASSFAFFKGLNDKAADGVTLSVNVDKGVPPGQYRICTLSASFAHTPLIMPVAQRGSQDDCIRVNAA